MYRGRTFSLSLPPFTKAVKWLVLINAAVYLLMLVLQAFDPYLQGMIFAALSLIPSLVVHGWIHQLVTYAFLHDGFWHIGGNMFGLWMFGSAMESEWGAKKFTEFYFFCAIGAALTTIAVAYSGLHSVNPNVPTVGASGAILGILMAFGMVFGDREIFMFPLPISFKAKYFVAIYGFFTLANAISVANPSQGGARIAYAAHLGGFIFGYLYVKFVPKRGLVYGTSERYFGLRNSYYRWKRKRAARKFEVYMRTEHDRKVTFDEHGNFVPDEDPDKKNGGSKSGWVN